MTRSQKKRLTKARRAAASGSRVESANVAPITAGSGPLHTTAGALKTLRQNKHNPLPYLKPEMLSRVLEAFEHGRIREAVLLWEKMAERDDMLSSVKPKREKDVSQLDMQVVIRPDSGTAGEDHQRVLLGFWQSVRAVNAYDRNERGGFRRLVKQMMTATSFKYAAHHIIWQPQANGELRATFEFVPLWMFENTTGKLRYLESMTALSGTPLDDSEWMVTTGDGLMIACSIGYLAKRSAFNDWLIFSEKFSVPGVLGRTSAAAGSPEANAMVEATQAFGHDWCAVITGDDGTHNEPIKIVQAQGNPSGMPMPAVIERVDQRIAGLYRGADRSSMSSGSNGQSFGASMQEKETDILRRDDAETIAETLEEISRLVIEWYFGNGVEPLARVELIVPVQEDSTSVVAAAGQLADRGAKVSSTALMDRLNIPKATDDVDALRPARSQESRTPEIRQDLENSLPGEADASLQELREALAADMQPIGEALLAAYQMGDFAAMTAALKKISKSMPALAGDASELSRSLASEMATRFLG
jgi:phage gp29-like protein